MPRTHDLGLALIILTAGWPASGLQLGGVDRSRQLCTTMPPVRPVRSRRRDRLGPYGDIGPALEQAAWEDTEYDARISAPILYVARMSKELPFWAFFTPHLFSGPGRLLSEPRRTTF